MKKKTRLAVLSLTEHKAWEFAYAMYADPLGSRKKDAHAAEMAWADMQEDFPRLRRFDGAHWSRNGVKVRLNRTQAKRLAGVLRRAAYIQPLKDRLRQVDMRLISEQLLRYTFRYAHPRRVRVFYTTAAGRRALQEFNARKGRWLE